MFSKTYGDITIKKISIDSRKVDSDTLFVPIIGENVDAHKFIPDVFENGCRVSLSSEDISSNKGMIVRVSDTVEALQKIGEEYRSQIKVPVIGVTGSVGKTTTRTMIATALTAGGKVYSTKGNFNSQIGVPITVTEFEDDAYIGVLELGMSNPGEMSKITSVARPDMVVFTNIGVSHIGQLGSRENILREKMHITDYMPEDGKVILNRENDLLSTYKLRDGLIPKYYGFDENNDAYAKNITLNNGLPEFTAVINGKEVRVNLSVAGRHMVLNSLAALLIADEYDVDLNKAAAALKDFEAQAHRQKLTEKNGITVIDDSYNASPDSMQAGLNVLSSLDNSGRKIAVLSEMRELGDEEENAHRQVGEHISSLGNIDLLLTYCPAAVFIAQEADVGEKVHFDDRTELLEYLLNNVRSGDAVLFKGSNGTLLYKSCEEFLDKI